MTVTPLTQVALVPTKKQYHQVVFQHVKLQDQVQVWEINFRRKGSEMFSQVQQGAEGVEEDCY